MSHHGPGRREASAATCVVVLVLALTSCGGSTSPPVASGPAQPCASLPAADPGASLPAGFPVLPDQVLYGPASQGATSIVFGRVAGGDVVALRDQLADRLETAGYAIDGTDQEAVEAEAHFSRPREGSVKVQQLCDGVLSVRYRLSG